MFETKKTNNIMDQFYLKNNQNGHPKCSFAHLGEV